MKLSELSTDKALDMLCELTPYISNIASDETLVSEAGKVIKIEGETNKYGLFLIAMERIGQIIPLVLKTHRHDVYGVLSTINDKSAEEIARQPSITTLRQIQEACQDRELINFFKSFTQQEQTVPSVPSASSPGSE